MIDDITHDGLLQIKSAAESLAKVEAKRIVQAVIADLRGRAAQDTFGDLAARHLWDEYCWSLQEGPFDDDMGWDDVDLGSVSGAFDGLVRMVIEAEIEKLPNYLQVFLTVKAVEESSEMDENIFGSIWMDGMVDLILEDLNSKACSRDLGLIGPYRAEVIFYDLEGSGTVWSALSDRGEAHELIAPYVDALLDPDSGLWGLADDLVDAYLNALQEESDGSIIYEFLDNFDMSVREMLTKEDVLPDLKEMRAKILAVMDG